MDLPSPLRPSSADSAGMRDLVRGGQRRQDGLNVGVDVRVPSHCLTSTDTLIQAIEIVCAVFRLLNSSHLCFFLLLVLAACGSSFKSFFKEQKKCFLIIQTRNVRVGLQTNTRNPNQKKSKIKDIQYTAAFSFWFALDNAKKVLSSLFVLQLTKHRLIGRCFSA